MEELEKILKHLPTSKPASPDPRAQNQGLLENLFGVMWYVLFSELMLRSNVTYIVAGVVVVGDKVLLIQEAKPSCRGDWYLPAGRMEANETIVVMKDVATLPTQTQSCVPYCIGGCQEGSGGRIWIDL